MLIIFDLDDTLVDTTRAITPIQLEKAVRAMREAGLDMSACSEPFVTIQDMDRDSSSAYETLRKFVHHLEGNHTHLAIGVKTVYGSIDPHLIVPEVRGARDMLKRLSCHHTLALVSMGHYDQQMWKLRRAGLDSAQFSKIEISSSEDKAELYQAMLHAFQVEASQVVVCGDRIDRDLVPAQKLGCRTIHVKQGRGLSSTGYADFVVEELKEIPLIVEKL